VKNVPYVLPPAYEVLFSVIKRKRILILYLFLPNHEDTV